MRWIWIDTFVDFVSGRQASAIKNVTRSEEHNHDLLPGYPILPPALMIEGMAQTAGILVGETRSFRENVILAKIRLAEFSQYAVPGDTLRYDAQISSIDERAAATSGTVSLNGALIGRVDLMFSYVNGPAVSPDAPDRNFVFTEEFMQLFHDFRRGLDQGGVRP